MDCKEEIVDVRIPHPEELKDGIRNNEVEFKLHFG